MSFKYRELEKQLENSCNQLHKDFFQKFSTERYLSVGGSKLEIFINELQREFENTGITFLANNKLEKDAQAKKRVFTITKLYAKKCIEDFSKV